MRSKSTQEALEEIIKVGVQSGMIVLSKGTTPDAARDILENAVQAGLNQIPDNVTIQIGGGREVTVPLDTLLRIAGPWISAGIDSLVEALSPAATKVIIDNDNVKVSWVIE